MGQKEQNDESQFTSVGPMVASVNADVSIVQSAYRSLGQSKPNIDSLFNSVPSTDSSMNPDDISVGEHEHSDDDNSADHEHNDRRRKHDRFSHHSSSRCSSSDSYASDFSNESDSDLSDDDSTMLEGVLQMGCLDVFFLPMISKNRQKQSLVKCNSKGEKELNLKLKGPLALGLEARSNDEIEKRSLETRLSSGSYGSNKGHKKISSKSKVRHFEDKLANDVTNHVRSIMSLSHESISEDKGDHGIPNASKNPALHAQMQFEQQQECYDVNPQQQSKKSQSHVNRGGELKSSKNSQQYPQKRQDEQLPSQIVVIEQNTFEENDEESWLTYEVTIAPDPPPSSLPKISENKSIDVESSKDSSDLSMVVTRGSKESSDLSMVVTRGSINSEDSNRKEMISQNERVKSNQNPTARIKRWRKANVDRLKMDQQLIGKSQNCTDFDEVTTDSSKPTSLSQPFQVEEKTVGDERVLNNISRSRSGPFDETFDGNIEYISKPIVPESPQKKDPEGDSLAFDSIFSRRIEKRRATKLKRDNPVEDSIVVKVDHTAGVKDPTEDIPPQHTSRNSIQKSTDRESKLETELDGVATATLTESQNKLVEMIIAPKVEPSWKEDPSYDAEDTENRAPHLLQDKLLGSSRRKDDAIIEKPKNPFHDDDILDDDDDLYEDDAHAYPLLTKSSSDDEDIFLSGVSTYRGSLSSYHSVRGNSDPLSPRRDAVSMTPSPRRRLLASPRSSNDNERKNEIVNNQNPRQAVSVSLTRPVASPINYTSSEWVKDTVNNNLSRKLASTKLERCPSGRLTRTDSYKCDDSASYASLSDNDIETEFFDSISTYNNK